MKNILTFLHIMMKNLDIPSHYISLNVTVHMLLPSELNYTKLSCGDVMFLFLY